MTISLDYFLITAAISMLISLSLAWLASFILYAKVQTLQSIFPGTHQLIRAHIDFLLMAILLVMSFYLCERLVISLPDSIILLTCFGALYNPLGFIMLAIKPEMANPVSFLEKLRVLLGFLPATIGYGYIMLAVLASLLS